MVQGKNNQEDMTYESEYSISAFRIRLGLVKRHKELHANVEDEWEIFVKSKQIPMHRRKSALTFYSITIATVAACIIGLFFFIRPNEKHDNIIFQANNRLENISITTEDGEVISLPATASYSTIDSTFRANSIDNNDVFSISSPRKHTCEFTLPDGSEVWLNAESNITYQSINNQRMINLSGEAYFKVSKDKDHPFVVQTNNIKTIVYGTEFNIRNYSDSDTHVTLVSGSVQVSNIAETEKIMLSPGYDVLLESDGKFKKTLADMSTYTLWKEGFFYFDKETLENVLMELGRWYNVTIELSNKSIGNKTLHFVANRNSSLDEAIGLLNMLDIAKIELYRGKIIIR